MRKAVNFKTIIRQVTMAWLLMFSGMGTAQAAKTVVVNEIMASNVGVVMSPATNFDGWVEFYNTTEQPVNLSGMYLSNDASDLMRWRMPADIGIIPAKGFLVVWLGSADIMTNQAPFKLDCDGGTIYLSDANGNCVASQEYPEALSRTAWARTTDGGDNWRWTSTPTPGESNATATFADERLDAPKVSVDSKVFTGSLQINVEIPQGAKLMYTTDGSVPTPAPATTQQGNGGNSNEPTWTNWIINGDCEGSDAQCFFSKDGDEPSNVYNKITAGVGIDGSRGIKIHSVDNPENTWDTQFFIYTPGHVWQMGEYYRFSMWVRADKSAYISIQSHQTPGAYIYWDMLCGSFNVTTTWQQLTFEGKVTESQVKGNDGDYLPLQTIAFNLNEESIENNYYFDDIVWESMDGAYDDPNYEISVRNNPGTESKTGKFTVSNTTNYVFRLFKDGYLPSVPVTRSYIKKEYDFTIPIVSIVGDEKYYNDLMWGIDVDGINGKPGNNRDYPVNWNMAWDRPVNFSYISPEGKMLFNQDVMTSVSGGWSRQDTPRSFKLKSNKVFDGLNHLDYSFFPQKPYTRNKALLVRNGGNDPGCRFMDPAMTTIVQRSGIDLDVQSTLQVAEYINGEFRGVLNLRETNNDKFVYANKGYNDEEIDYFENFTFTDGTDEAWWRLIELSENINGNGVYDEVKKLLDIDEFTNYMATEMFLGNSDWPHNNVKGYRSRDDGRFRFILFDLDQIFNRWCPMNHLSTLDGDFANEQLVILLRNLLGNNAYRKKFIDTFCIIAGSVFERDRVMEMIDEIADSMRPMLQLDGRSPDGTANEIKGYMQTRLDDILGPDGQLEQFQPAQLGNLQRQTVKLSANAQGAHITINGIDVPYADFNGYLFQPIKVEAKAPAGYRFTGWTAGSGSIVSTEPVMNLPTGSTVTLTACFTKLSDADMLTQGVTPLRVNEVSAGNTVYVNEWFKHNDWFEIYNTTDTDLDVAGLYVSDDEDNPLKYQIPTGGVLNTIVPAGGHRILWADEMNAASQLHTNFKLKNEDEKIVLVCSSDDFVANNQSYFDKHPEMKDFADGIIYSAHKGDQSVGRYPDGGKSFYKMNNPTIERSNSLTSADLYLSEDNGLTNLEKETFTLELFEGWNWMSHPLGEPIAVSRLSDHANRIVGKKNEAIRDSKLGMTGALKELETGNLYKVNMQQDDIYTRKGFFCEEGRAIMLLPGWNWIGYTVDGQQSLSDALTNYMVEEGDKIMGLSGFATYENGSWQGTLSALETGKGYMLYTNQAKTLTFKSPSTKVNLSRMNHKKSHAARTRTSSLFRPVSKHAYPNVMGVIAELLKNGEKVEADCYMLYAYDADGECRGEGKWLNGLAYMTLYGKGGESLSYRAVDLMDGTVYTIRETTSFAEDIIGSTSQPFVLTLGKTEGNATMIDGVPTAPATSEIDGYYNLNGSRVSFRTASRGIYLVKYKDGSFKKVIVK